MKFLTKDEAKTLLDKVLAFSKSDELSVSLYGGRSGNIRYANNAVSTSGETSNISLEVTAVMGKKSGTASVNEFDDASLEKTVRRAEETARLAPENPEFMPASGPQKYLETKQWFDSTAQITPEYRAHAAHESIEPGKAKGLMLAGFLDDGASLAVLANSRGLFAYNQSTKVDFSVTARTPDGLGSGYALADFNDASLLRTGESTERAIAKAQTSVGAKVLEPGKYTVILEPAASVELLRNMVNNMNARSADEGRSFLAKKGGGTKLGESLFDERVTIYTDPTDTNLPGSPFTSEGLPREKVNWIENGLVKNLIYSRYWAEQKNTKPVASSQGFIMTGTDQSIQDLIASTEKGVLVTRMWYIRTVDPQTLLYTGLTRDGTFYIENGKIKHPVKNFRFNESPLAMLRNLEALGKPVRVEGCMVPPMRVKNFNFASLSDAV